MRLSPAASWALLAAAWLLSGLAIGVGIGRACRTEPPSASRSRGRPGPRPSGPPPPLPGLDGGIYNLREGLPRGGGALPATSPGRG